MDNTRRTLSPRIRRVVERTMGEGAEDWKDKLAGVVDSVMAVTTLFGDGAEFAHAIQTTDLGAAEAIWAAADEEADAVATAMAKVQAVAKRYTNTPQAEARGPYPTSELAATSGAAPRAPATTTPSERRTSSWTNSSSRHTSSPTRWARPPNGSRR